MRFKFITFIFLKSKKIIYNIIVISNLNKFKSFKNNIFDI